MIRLWLHAFRRCYAALMTAIHVRPANADDMPAVLRLIRELARFAKAEDQVRACEADLVRDGFGPQPCFEVLIAERREPGPAGQAAPIGFALYFQTYSTWEGRPGLFVEDLYVTEPARGIGAGRRLLAELAALAQARRCKRLDLSVLHWNSSARDFYEALGFEPMADWRPYRLMEPALTALAAEAAAS